MKRILIISDPPAAPGYLPRLRYLCDYLYSHGYDITLITEQYQELRFKHDYPIITIPMYSGSTLEWALKTLLTLITDWHNRAFARKALAEIPNLKSEIPNLKYDFVICTTFSDFPLGAAERIAKQLHLPLICDIRDLDEQVKNSRYQYHHSRWSIAPFRYIYRSIHIRRRNRVLSRAHAITTVSPWHVDFIRQLNPNVELIYNGYDPQQFYPEPTKTDKFRLCYIGSIFAWQEPALNLVREAVAESGLDIELDIHTPQHQALEHSQLGNAIRRSSVMLVLTSPDTHGMLTTKFYEALGCQRPVLCVPTDRGALAELISYTNAGIATDSKPEIIAFLRAKYLEWQQLGYTTQDVQHYHEFSRLEQTRKWVEWIEK